jgi:dimethylsulfone monooxygenase
MRRKATAVGRRAFYSNNQLKLGLFGANCSSGRAVTTVPERWSGDWEDCVTNFQGATAETVTWAAGLLAKTEHLTIFGTVHAPLVHPLVAAKQFVTADHIGNGRFGLNLVCGWNEGEFTIFGATLRDHEVRYSYAQEWLDVVKAVWSQDGPFDFTGKFIKVRDAQLEPKPYDGSWPIIMNAGASPTGQAFAIRNCDALFSTASLDTLSVTTRNVHNFRRQASAEGREIDVYTVGVITCRSNTREAQD